MLKPEQVLPAMRPFTIALGVQCNYGYVMEPTRDRSLDDKQTKKTALAMLQMLNHVDEMLVTREAAGAPTLVNVDGGARPVAAPQSRL